jgi:hypothetical protein
MGSARSEDPERSTLLWPSSWNWRGRGNRACLTEIRAVGRHEPDAFLRRHPPPVMRMARSST